MKKTVLLSHVILAFGLLVAGCAAPASTEMPTVIKAPTQAAEEIPTEAPAEAPPTATLGDLILGSIGPEWDVAFDVPLGDPEELAEIDTPSAEGAHIRAWQSGDGLIWAAVYQFADPAHAGEVYASAAGELGDDAQVITEDPAGEHEVVVSESPLGLALYLVRRGRYVLTAGSAITDPDADPPDPALVEYLAFESDALIDSLGPGVASSGLTLPLSAQVLPVSSGTEWASAGGIARHRPPTGQSPIQETTKITTEIDLYNGDKWNGTITLRIEVGSPAQVVGEENKREYQVYIYVVRIDQVQDDRDGVFRGAGDIIVGADITLKFKRASDTMSQCQFGFRTKEIGYIDSHGDPFIWHGGNGYPIGPFSCKVERGATKLGYHVVVEVRDNDGDDALDTIRTTATVVSKVARAAGLDRTAERAKEIADAVDVVKQEKGPQEARIAAKAETIPESAVENARNLKDTESIGSGYLPSAADANLPADPGLADSFEPDDTMGQAKQISTDGTLQAHDLHVVADHDYVFFQAQAGIGYAIETLSLGSDIDTLLYLYDGQGTLLASNDDSGDGGLASRILWIAPTSGTYYVMTRHRDDTAAGPNTTYSVRVSTRVLQGDPYEPDDTTAQAKPIDTGGTRMAHNFHTTVDVDHIYFTAEQGAEYIIETGSLQGGCDTKISLLDGQGNLLSSDDDSGEGSASRITWTAPSGGAYYVKIEDFHGWAGSGVSYEIWVSR